MPYLFQRRHAGGRPVQRDGSPWLRPAVAVRPNPRQLLLVFTCFFVYVYLCDTFLCDDRSMFGSRNRHAAHSPHHVF